jgi:TRAP-type C4-dicarboxylate transport system permease small subunit
LVILICVIFLRESVDFWLGGLTISASSVPINLAVFYSCAPFSFAMLTLLGIERLIEQSYLLYAHCFTNNKATH